MLNKETLRELRVTALREKNTVLKNQVSFILGQIEGEEKGSVDKQGKVTVIKLTEKDILTKVIKLIKDLKGNLEIYKKRNDKDKEATIKTELEALEYIVTLNSEYKPPITEEEVLAIVDSLGAKSMSDMGKVMSNLKENYLGRYDPAAISKLLQKKLA